MDFSKFNIFTLLIIYMAVLSASRAKTPKNTTFNATKEWQEIPEGMAIPAGLHVRINFQTRKREAKLLDESDEEETGSQNNAIIVQNEINANANKIKSSKKTLLSDALKNLQKSGKKMQYTPENLSQIKRDYKAAAAAEHFTKKNNFESVREQFQSDAEIITQLIEEFMNLTKHQDHKTFRLTAKEQSNRQTQILDTFDYMLHQIDNSMLFVSQGGLDILLPIVANETQLPLRVKAMRLLGALSQNNPKVQVAIFKQNFPNLIIKTLISSSNTEELSTALYAFGSLLRKYPLAQKTLLSTVGMQALVGVIKRECELKVKAKAITIVSDILEEYHYMLSSDLNAEEKGREDMALYKELKLYDWLTANEFCEAVGMAVVGEALQLLEQPDIVESFIEAIEQSYAVCKSTWMQNIGMYNSLLAIRSQYAASGDEYQNEIAQRITNSLPILENTRHEEL